MRMIAILDRCDQEGNPLRTGRLMINPNHVILVSEAGPEGDRWSEILMTDGVTIFARETVGSLVGRLVAGARHE